MLPVHLNQIDAEARDREEQLVKQMMEKEGITEELKRLDNMEFLITSESMSLLQELNIKTLLLCT